MSLCRVCVISVMVSFDFDVSYSSCWGYSLINTLKLKKNLLYLSFYLCCERCVVCAWFCIHNHLFVFFLLFLLIQYISLARCSCYAYDPAHMSALLFYLHDYYSNLCVFVIEPVYAFPSSSIFVHIFGHLHVYCLCYVLYLYPCFCVFLLFPTLNRHLWHGVFWCHHIPTHILFTWFHLYFHLLICTSTMSKSNIKFATT